MANIRRHFGDLSLEEQQQALAVAESILQELLRRVTIQQVEVQDEIASNGSIDTSAVRTPAWGDATLN